MLNQLFKSLLFPLSKFHVQFDLLSVFKFKNGSFSNFQILKFSNFLIVTFLTFSTTDFLNGNTFGAIHLA
jgi:hypothetical protein